MDFAKDAQNWPHRDLSRQVRAGGNTWHLQEAGDRSLPLCLLLHGTGATTHSWRGLLPLLQTHFHVVAVDLPGHGFTSCPSVYQLSLPGMARQLAEVLGELDLKPDLMIGHSAGAAIAIRMVLDGAVTPKALVSIAGALRPFQGSTNSLYSMVAKLLVLNPLVPRIFAWRARDPDVVKELLSRTGSRLDAEGLALYGRVARDPDHAAAALGMMANWDLESLGHEMRSLQIPLLLLTGARDRMIPAEDAEGLAKTVDAASWVAMDGLGHLAHEEAAERVCSEVLTFWQEVNRPAQN